MIPNCKMPRSRCRRRGTHAPRPRPAHCAGWTGWSARSARISRCSRGTHRPEPGCEDNPGPPAGTRGPDRRRGRYKSRRSCGESQTCRASGSAGEPAASPKPSDHPDPTVPPEAEPSEPSQIRMIEKSKLFRTLAVGTASGNSPHAISIAQGMIAHVRSSRGRGERSWRVKDLAGVAPQCAIRTGTVACDRMWLVGPPKIIWRRRLWV